VPRTITDKETQTLILSEMECPFKNPKIPLAARLLMTYFSVRPGQLLAITHGDIDHSRGGIWITRKGRKGQKKREFTPLLPEDMELIKSHPRGLPQVPFFQDINRNILYKKWQKAVASLKAKGELQQDFNVCLYAGTRHTTMSELEGVSPEEIRETSKHLSLGSFKHYFRWNDDKSRRVFRQTKQEQTDPPFCGSRRQENIMKLNR